MRHRQLFSRALAPRRTGRSVASVTATIVLLAALGGGAYALLNSGAKKTEERPLAAEVKLAPFEHIVLEQGEIESSSNVEIRCEVKSRGSGGITILEVIPEGTLVEEGTLLVRLDSTALDQEYVSQQIAFNTSEAAVIQAKNTFEAAQIARVEYLEGTFKKDEQLILSEIFVAEQNLRTAQLAYSSAERLSLRGIVTSLQLEGEKFAVEKAKNELEGAQTKLEVLRKYTREKTLKQLDSDIASAQAKWKSEEKSFELEQAKLKEIREQVAKCTIRAPRPGQVVYANKYSSSSRGSSSAEFVVEPGAVVREQQPIVRLPDSNQMQVKATVNESRVNFVKPGMPVAIRCDALRDSMLKGEVIKVNQYAEPGGWSSGTVKKYATFIRILDPPAELRSGMNAEVRIYVERRLEALQVPVQAVVEHEDGEFYGLVESGAGYETRKLKRGPTNDTFMVLEGGVAAGERFVLNPRGRTELSLPEVKAKPAAVAGEVKPPEAAPVVAKGDPGEKKKGSGRPTAAQVVASTFEEFDTDKDQKLGADELAKMPEDRRSRWTDADVNKDGSLDRPELTAAVTKFFSAMREKGGPGGGPGATP